MSEVKKTYIAMARKWRPKTFLELTGQDHVAQTLRNAIEGGRLAHAFLFTGTRGVGKTTSARILARTLNCTDKVDVLVPCGKCLSCQEIDNGTSLDVVEIDGASNNSVDDVRGLIETVKYASMNGMYRVIVIDEVHMLSHAAFNALLKTLEEPPEHVLFIFATTEANKVPQTILSRVQKFDFKRIGPQAIMDRLTFVCQQEEIAFEDSALAIIAEKADGSMRDSLTYFDQVYAFSGSPLTLEATYKVLGVPPEEIFFDIMLAIAKHDQRSCHAQISRFIERGIEMSDFLGGLLKFQRNLMYSRVDGIEALEIGVHESNLSQLQELASKFGRGDILRLAKMTSDLILHLKTASQPRIALEMGLARMAYLDRTQSLRALLRQLDSSEAVKKNS
jgi:DNA polymerase III subunit gamma/tau